MFYDTSNFISTSYNIVVITLHATGVIIYSEFIIESWPYYQLWYFWAAFMYVCFLLRLLPLILEISASCFGNILYGTAFTRRKSRKGN